MSRLTDDGAPKNHEYKNKKMDNECYEKAKERGQMTFTVVEQDMTAPYVILEWIKLNLETCPVEKLRDAFEDVLAFKHSGGFKKYAD